MKPRLVRTVGNKRVALMQNGCVLIEEPSTEGFASLSTRPGEIPNRGQKPFTIATGRAGLKGVIEALQEMLDHLNHAS